MSIRTSDIPFQATSTSPNDTIIALVEVEPATFRLRRLPKSDIGIPGPTGSQGGAGAAGATGATGATGPQGPNFTHSTLAYSATTNLDFDGDDYRTLELTGNVTFTTSNRAAPKALTIRVIADGSTRTFTFPAGWIFVGAAAPASIAANKEAILSITCFGTTDATIRAAYAAQP